MKYLTAACAGIITTCIIAWLFWAGGFNFDHRGEGLVMFTILSLYCGGMAGWLTLIVWKDK